MKFNPFSRDDINLFKRTSNYVKPYKVRFMLAFFCVLSGVVFGLVQPLIWAKILGGLFSKNFTILITMVEYMILFFVLNTIVEFLQSYIFSSLNQKIIFDIKRDMFTKILNLPIKAFDNMMPGEFISRLNNDASVISKIITDQLLNNIVNVLKVLIIGVVMFSISVELSLVVLIAFPCTYFLFLFFGKIMRKKQSEIAKLNDSYFGNIQESVLGIREIKCMGIKNTKLRKFMLMGDVLKEKSINIGILNSISGVFSGSIEFVTELLLILLGFYIITKGQLGVEIYIAFAAYSGMFNNSLMEITKLNSSIQQALVSIGRIFELLDNLNFSVEKFGKVNKNQILGEIKFENVCFDYNNNINVLKGITFNIKPNKKVAFVGASGVGKTTLSNLLMRFYDVSSGSIKIDDVNIEDYDEDSIRRHISAVRQEPFLFNMSIKENLLLSKPDATMEEIIASCTSAYIHDHIVSMPLGYDSIVGERGVNFSGGQRQRIAIARAILKKSKIILFDEATSALDNESQYAIKNAIDLLAKCHTVIIIAHRLFTVIDADEIIVLKDGKIVGIGSHEILLNNNVTYNKLYKNEVDTINKIPEGILLT